MKARGLLVFKWAAAVAFMVLLTCWALRTEPPQYQGKTAAQWFQAFSAARMNYRIAVPTPSGQAFVFNESSLAGDETAIALRRLGTNTAIYLARRIERSWGPLTKTYADLYFKMPRSLSRYVPSPLASEDDAIAAALVVLGPDAAPAIPTLVRSLSQGTAFQRFVYSQSLAHLHYKPEDIDPALQTLVSRNELPDAVRVISVLHVHTPTAARVLVQAISGTNSTAAATAWAEAAHFGQHSDVLMPTITAALAREGSSAQLKALSVLQAFGSQASPALPDLVRSLQDTNEEVRYQSARTLEAMGTNALPALAALCRATNDPSVMVQRCSSRVISNLTASPEL